MLTKFPSVFEGNITENLLPAVRLCANTLSIQVTNWEIGEIVSRPEIIFEDPRAAVVRHIAERLYHIYTSKQTSFRLDAHTLMQDAIQFDWCQENSFFSESVWDSECRYLVPATISEASVFPDLLVPLMAWRNFGFQFRHAAPLGTALLLATFARLAMTDERLRKQSFSLLQTMLMVPAWQLGPVLFRQIHEIICQEEEE